jgi:hypothetical protein
MSNKRKFYVDKKDTFRSLLTETLPYEVPIIFGNEMLYKYCAKNSSVHVQVHKVANKAFLELPTAYTIPFKYEILKSQDSHRELSLIHPRSQIRMSLFLQRYSELICYYTTKSKYSIRAPKQLASSFYVQNLGQDKNKYRDNNIEVLDDELKYKYLSSFFTYEGFEKLYKFYSSKKFISLERKFRFQWCADVSNCFSSIYSHSISWAVLDKNHIKDNVTQKEGFGPRFDLLMQKSNYNETNGIPIGPEVSRVFAEIIFQAVDVKLHEALLKKEFRNGVHYSVKRYVDDYFIFSNNEEISACVLKLLKHILKEFNLHLNERKLVKLNRPFLTSKSKLIKEVQVIVDEWFEDLFEKRSTPSGLMYIPRDQNHHRKFIDFIDKIKMSCMANQLTYDDISSFIQGCFYKRITKLIEQPDMEGTESDLAQYEDGYLKSTLAVVEIMLFFYSTAPSVSSSYSLAKSLILTQRFFEIRFPDSYVYFAQSLYDQVLSYLDNIEGARAEIDVKELHKELHLESLNLLIVLAELGNKVLLPEKLLSKLFKRSNLSYFEIVVLLYYIKDYPLYASLRSEIEVQIKKEYIQGPISIDSSEYIHCAFDLLTCPYIRADLRAEIAETLLKSLGLRHDTNEITATVSAFQTTHFFVKWSGLDLLNILEKKKLQSPYE